MTTLTEIIFTGQNDTVSLSFLEEFIINSKEARFNTPEISKVLSFEQAINIIASSDYFDFVLILEKLKVETINLKNIFINLGIDHKHLELLFFFDLSDIGYTNLRVCIDLLQKWAASFQKKYGFENFICQLDNGNKNEFYFNNYGLGPLYELL